jgi:hypothetical protein
VEIYDPADDSLIGEFGLTVGGWDNWRAKKWQRCFMVVREPVSGAQFLFPDIIAPEPLLHMDRLQADAAYQELKTKRQAMKSALSAGHGLGTEDAESDCP